MEASRAASPVDISSALAMKYLCRGSELAPPEEKPCAGGADGARGLGGGGAARRERLGAAPDGGGAKGAIAGAGAAAAGIGAPDGARSPSASCAIDLLSGVVGASREARILARARDTRMRTVPVFRPNAAPSSSYARPLRNRRTTSARSSSSSSPSARSISLRLETSDGGSVGSSASSSGSLSERTSDQRFCCRM